MSFFCEFVEGFSAPVLNHRIYHIQQPTNAHSAQRGLYVYTKVYIKQTYLPSKMMSLLPISSTTFIYPLTFLYKSFADPIIQCRPISAYVLAGLTTEALPREKENFGWPLVIRLFSDVSRCSECWSQAQHIKGTAGMHLLSYFLHCSQPCCVRIRQPLPISLGERKPDSLFMRLSMFWVSAFTSTLNLHMYFVLLSALERRE